MQHALINAVMAIVRFFRNPIAIALLCVLLLIFWVFRGGELTRGTTVRTQAEAALQELAAPAATPFMRQDWAYQSL